MMSTNSPFGAQEDNDFRRELEEAKMLLAKRPRPSPSTMIRRTSSIGAGIVAALDEEEPEAEADIIIEDDHDERLGIIPLSPPSNVNYFSSHLLMPTTAPHFLRTCALCKRPLPPAGRDIYMYRGDTAFCSLECREKQIRHDERKEKWKVPVAPQQTSSSIHSASPGAPPTNAPSQDPTNTKSIAAAST